MESSKRDILFEDGVCGLDSHLKDDLENKADQRVHQNLLNLNVGAGL